MKCQEFYNLLYSQIRDLEDDYYGFYEQVWSLPKGKFAIFKYRKLIKLNNLVNIYVSLSRKNRVEIYIKSNENYFLVRDYSRVLRDFNNWKDPSIQEECVYFVTSGSNYDDLLKFLIRKCNHNTRK